MSGWPARQQSASSSPVCLKIPAAMDIGSTKPCPWTKAFAAAW